MNKSAFLHIIRNASAITSGEAEELEELIVNFPYCQTAHLLIAKAAYDRGSMLANQKLRKAAAYATNRQLLRKLIYAPAPAVPVSEPAVAAITPLPEPVFAPVPEADVPVLAHPEEEVVDQEETYETWPMQAGDVGAEAVTQPLWEAEDTPIHNLKEVTGSPISDHPHEERLREEIEVEPATLAVHSAGQAEKEEDLDELLYIDRIFPFRHVLPEHLPAPPAVLPGEEAFPAATLEATGGVPASLPELYATSLLADPESDPELIEMLLETTDSSSDIAVPEPDAANLPAAEELAKGPLDWQEEEKPAIETETGTAEPNAAPLRTEVEASPAVEAPADDDQSATAFADDLIARIYAQNQLGYAMSSSRLGEWLEVKSDLSTKQPFYFYPDLILEYVQEHEEVEMLPPAPVDSVLDQQLNLINQFLKLSPRLKQFAEARVRTEPQEDLSLKSSKIKKSLASENLATIFLKQGKVKKAIKIYEHLITKIPEKKAYFADQIEKLKQLT